MNRRIFALGLSVIVLSASACSEDNPTQSSIIQTLEFVVDGQPFIASSGDATKAGDNMTLTGTFVSGGVTRTLTIAIQAAAAGTIEIGGPNSPTLTYTEQSSGVGIKTWAAGSNTGSGSIVLTQLSATKVIGTFIANLPPVTSTGATSTKALTAGTFDLTF